MITKFLDIAPKIGTPWSLAAFAIAAVVAIVSTTLRARGKSSAIGWGAFGVIVILGVVPIVAPAYLDSRAVFRVRVNVLDDHNMPVDDASVTSSLGGEPKKVAGGWEFDIPAQAKPLDGKLTIYAVQSNAFLKGHTDVVLGKDFSPATTVSMSRDGSAQLKGIVVDGHGEPIEGVAVEVLGYESEAVRTGSTGTFTLRAHAADGQQVEVAAHKPSIGSTTQWCQAGSFPATVVLNRR
jgi:hypothetical protein